MGDRTGNLPSQPGIFPDYSAPIVRNGEGGRELVMARWGMPSSKQALFEATKSAIHPKAMPVILTTADESDLWMTVPWNEATVR